MAESYKPAEKNISGEDVPSVDLERKFSKELAQDVRDETAQKLREARRMPKTGEALRKIDKGQKKDYSWFTGSKGLEAIENFKKSIVGRIFQTYEFKSLSYEVDRILREARVSKIEGARYDYKKQLDAILDRSPLTEEEIKKYLSEGAMEAMGLDDYLVLLKRLSGNFVTHVTRQGVDERVSFHHVGTGEVYDSFEKILKDRKLQSFLANFMTDPNSIPYMVGNIKSIKEETGLVGERLIERVIETMEKRHDQNMPADQSSVHMATNDVASEYYGAEKGYDFYFYFPAEFIAYNYFHHHADAGNTQGLSGDLNWTGKHNDLGVWNDGKGVPINAGITCIPKDVNVDRNTGSQYKLVDGKPVRASNGLEYELAEDTVLSQEYWERYFEANPELRPNKIVYGNFHTMPSFHGTQAYQELFKRKVFKTGKELPDFEETDTETFAQYKIQLAGLVKTLEEEGIV